MKTLFLVLALLSAPAFAVDHCYPPRDDNGNIDYRFVDRLQVFSAKHGISSDEYQRLYDASGAEIPNTDEFSMNTDRQAEQIKITCKKLEKKTNQRFK